MDQHPNPIHKPTRFAFLKKKKVFIPLIIGVIILYFGYSSYRKSHQPPVYETAQVVRGDLKQTVDATGKIESVNGVSLRFEVPGTLTKVAVREGDAVKVDQLLANLRLSELNATVAQASANLNQKLAGATNEDRSYYKAAMESAKAAWDQSQIDAVTEIKNAEAALQTAKNNMSLVEGGENSRIVSNAYENSVAALQAALSKVDEALSQSDNILGIDNSMANDNFEAYLAAGSPTKLNLAKNLYQETGGLRLIVKNQVNSLTTLSPHAEVDTAFTPMVDVSAHAIQLLTAVSDVLNATLPLGSLTQVSLENKKSTIETTRSSMTAQYTSLLTQKQSLENAKTSYDTYLVAYNKAAQGLEQAKANAESSVKIKESTYKQAEANYLSKINPPREVDLAYYRAALSAAVAQRDKAILKAPFDGIVTKVNKKVGEAVSSVDAVIEMLSPHFEVKVDIPETDVSKISVGDTTSLTLDAFGEDVKFDGTITAIDPSSTEVQDVVYYRVTNSIAEAGRPIKSGMTANVVVSTDTRPGVLYIPSRAIRTNATGKIVRVLINGKEEERQVMLGLKGDDGKTEIMSGLNEGETIILSVKTTN